MEVLRGLATAQADAGHAVTVCTTDRGNPAGERLPGSYFDTFYPAGITLKVFAVTYSPLLISVPLARWIRQHVESFDIVHVHGLYRFPVTFAAREAARQGIPYVIQPHGSLDPYLYGTSSRSVVLKRLYERWFDWPNFHSADAIHYTASDERERSSFLAFRAPSFVVPNGLNWEQYRVLPTRGAWRMRLKLGEEPIVLFLGRLHFKKGLDLLIPAFDTLRQRIPNVQLMIAGPENDDYGAQVRSWVHSRELGRLVHFVGPLQGADVIQAYVDADVFALPSYTENFGMTVAEAMACALPVVISDQVNIHADVANAGAGLVTRCDASEVTAALQVLLRDSGGRVAMGSAGRRFVQAHYTWRAIVTDLTREYQTAARRRRGEGTSVTPVHPGPSGTDASHEPVGVSGERHSG